MKNEDIHKGFEEMHVRDFLAKSLDNRSYIGEVGRLEKNIRDLQAQLEKAKKHEAVVRLMAAKGWDQFDVSDYIERYNSDTYFQFIGTEEEFKRLINKI